MQNKLSIAILVAVLMIFVQGFQRPTTLAAQQWEYRIESVPKVYAHQFATARSRSPCRSGPSRTLRVGNREILIKFRKRLVGAGSAAGPVITALQYLGKKGISESIERQLRLQLPEAVKQELLKFIPELPAWIEKPVRRIVG